MKKEKFMSITRKDLDIQTFKAGGKGGQHQNTCDSGVRIIHRESGAVGESRNERSQYQNKKLALKRLTETVKFKIWLNRKLFELSKGKSIEKQVEESLDPKNLKIEVRDENCKWKIKEKF